MRIHEDQQKRIVKITDNLKRKPCLGVLLVGEDPASISYVTAKKRASQKVGMECKVLNFTSDISQNELLTELHKLNQDATIDGIIVQLPLPNHINSDLIVSTVAPQKDVDGLHPYNLGMLLAGRPTFIPATPAGTHRLLIEEKMEVKGKNVTIIGRSRLVGMPLAVLLSNRYEGGDATVTICHRNTVNISQHIRRADIIIAAVGKPNLVNKEDVMAGAVVIDIGVNRVPDQTCKKGYRLAGDVNFDEVSQVASAITPVPGGVGPMTIAMLIENVLKASQKREIWT